MPLNRETKSNKICLKIIRIPVQKNNNNKQTKTKKQTHNRCKYEYAVRIILSS